MEQETTASDAGRLVTTRRDAVVELAITNPGARNALAPAMYADGLRAFAEASADPTVRAVMLHGADGFFCAGGNLNRLLANRARAPEHQRASVDQLNRWVLAIRAAPSRWWRRSKAPRPARASRSRSPATSSWRRRTRH